MAITDGTQPVTPQAPNTPPEIKLNLNFDESPTVINSWTPAPEQWELVSNEHMVLTGIPQEIATTPIPAPQQSDMPMFLKIETPIESPKVEVTPIQDIQLEFTAEENNSTPLQPEMPVEEIAQPADAWLAQEDALIKKTEEVPVQTEEVKIPQIQEAAPEKVNPLLRTEPQQIPAEEKIAPTQEQQNEIPLQAAPEVIPQAEQTAGVQEVSVPTPPQEVKQEPVEIKVEPTVPQQIPEPVPQPQPTTIPQTSLEEDMKIIQNLSLEQAPKKIEASTQPEPIPQADQKHTLNLDSLLNTPTNNTPQAAAPAPQQTIIPPINTSVPAPTQQTVVSAPNEEKKSKWTKILLFVLLFVSLGAVGFFIFKTMYPVEFAGLVSVPTGDNQVLPIEAPILASGDMLSNDVSGDILTGNVLSGNAITGAAGDTSGQHGSADDAMFSDLQDLGSTQIPSTTTDTQAPSSDSLLSKLRVFIEQGTKVFEDGKANNDKIKIKFWGYIKNKATTLANSLASWEQLDTQMVQNYLAQFSGYLSQLQPATNETNTQWSTEISPSLSGEAPAIAIPTAPTQTSGFSEAGSATKAQ